MFQSPVIFGRDQKIAIEALLRNFVKTRDMLAKALDRACQDFAGRTAVSSTQQARFQRYSKKISKLLDRANSILDMELLFVVPDNQPLPMETKYYEDEFMDIVKRVQKISKFNLQTYIQS
jgi:hypothetical protein